ncbi:CaiB/BaiF CoA transferase family protein [Brevibacterium luteolum]|uniref:CaiB/BaiF CoA transferase family protein n=1 Tax=Brevibacterium luteolum TaxID=199591 RepID=UPI00223C0751|nr:CoA transferase [Brevibacterium luteolum]MCT1872316.1 CoA transferase [Brevibacterium luteolum]MCT1889745.1 CoA transferase [Brevibacterium luteolum]MCT1892257.1 CoA transferase [Brevibacterium luteolum]MCT1923543.1 CoA transferase [Brevibacterium luteolum]
MSSTSETTTRPGPLSGYTVVDLSRALAGPHAGQMLGDLGARVIKVENPASGDDSRSWGPPFVGPEDDPQATYFFSCNRNKESIALNLKDDGDKEVLAQLIERADVLVENFRGGVLTRLGFSTERCMELNPRLVILSITGFGHDGPEASRAGYDQIAQGEAGLMSLTGSGPDDMQKVGVPIADLLSGIYGSYGVLAALLERERTGRGKVVRTSLIAGMVGVHAFQGTRATVAGENPAPGGNHHPSLSPYGLFHCKGGAVQISVGNQNLWHKLCAAFDIDPETQGMATNAERVANRPAVISVIEERFRDYTAEELLEKLAAAGIPSGIVRSLQEVYQWEQALSQGLKISVEHPVLGEIDLPGPPLRFFDADTEGVTESTPREHLAPPLLNEHGDAIRRWLEETP